MDYRGSFFPTLSHFSSRAAWYLTDAPHCPSIPAHGFSGLFKVHGVIARERQLRDMEKRTPSSGGLDWRWEALDAAPGCRAAGMRMFMGDLGILFKKHQSSHFQMIVFHRLSQPILIDLGVQQT